MQTEREKLENLTHSVLNFEEGDVLTLSGWISTFEELAKEHGSDVHFAEVLYSLIDLVTSELKGGVQPEFIKKLTANIDRLTTLIQRSSSTTSGNIDQKGKTGDVAGAAIPTEILEVFMVEAHQRLERAQELVLDWEHTPADTAAINELFRVFHTIKGECGFLKLASLGQLAHTVENLLDLLRSGKIELDESIPDLLLQGVDHARTLLSEIKDGQVVYLNHTNLDSFVETVDHIAKPCHPSIGEILVDNGSINDVERQKILHLQKESAFTSRFGEIAVARNVVSEQDLEQALVKQAQGCPDPDTVLLKTQADPLIMVRSSRVNDMVDLIGELLIMLGQDWQDNPSGRQTRKIALQLQNIAMNIRTESAKKLFNSVNRSVRDLSKRLEKKVHLVTFGEDLEIDRDLIEKLEEPLVHIIRNSMDHGIGTPEERVAAGKPESGEITLGALRKGNTIEISLRDDGRGLNKEKILSKAVNKGLVSQEQALAMSDYDAYQLIFVNGFSTAEAVGYVSGRGVGMDIVRQTIQSMRGRIVIETEAGKYLLLTLIFPLSTAVIDGVIVQLGAEAFIIPAAAVIETIKLANWKRWCVEEQMEMIEFRGAPVPLVFLERTLNNGQAKAEGGLGVVVENSDGQLFVFVVDDVLSKSEVVLKSLGPRFRHLKTVSAATVLSGGHVALLIDIDQVVLLSKIGQNR